MINPKTIVSASQLTLNKDNNSILDQVNFELAEAEFCYLIGATGAGKSSFLKSLYGAEPAISGDLSVLDFDMNNLPKSLMYKLRRKIGMVFQDFKLFDQWTAAQNLEYVLAATDWKDTKKISDRVEEALNLVELSQYANSITAKLSGGQQQRLAVARAIINYPTLLIADEPTGNLDQASADKVMYLIKKLTEKFRMATIFATHDHRLIEKFPARVYRIAEGKITEQ